MIWALTGDVTHNMNNATPRLLWQPGREGSKVIKNYVYNFYTRTRPSHALFIHMPRHIYYDNLVGIKVRNEQYTYTYNF